MIEINLLPGRPTRRRRGVGLKMPDFRGFFSGLKSPWLGLATVVWVLVLLGIGATFAQQQARLGGLDSDLTQARAEHRRFRAVVAQKRQAERVRDSLVEEIQVIRQIDSDRYVWPHLLDEIAKALPDFTWLRNVSELAQPADSTDPMFGGVYVSISGETMDVQAYTSFLRNLAASPWLADVTGNNFATAVEDQRPVTTFNVSARFRVADSAYIRTVPVIQSVR